MGISYANSREAQYVIGSEDLWCDRSDSNQMFACRTLMFAWLTRSCSC